MSDVNQIEISADGQDITITIGDYSDADARAAISVVDSGGDGSLAYNNVSGVITYTGPSASEVRAHFTAGSGISIASGVITNTRADTNTTYTQNASAATGGANLNLVGSDATTDTVKFANGTNVTVTRTDADTITIASTDTNTTYSISAETATGGANLRLTGSDTSTDNVKFASGTGITVSRTDDSTVTIDTTITQYTDALARQAISVASNTGDGDLTYNNTNGQFSYTGPGTTEYRAAIGVSNASGDGSLTYSTSTGVITYAGPTNANYRGAVSAANTGTGYGSLAYDTPTGVFTYDRVTGANIRTEVVDGRNLTYTGSTLNLDKALVDVNSVTAESATDLTLDGKNLVLKTRDVSVAANTLSLSSLGYRARAVGSTAPLSAYINATNIGTTSETFNIYYLSGLYDVGSDSMLGASTVAGQAKLTGVVIMNPDGEVVDATTITDLVGKPVLDYDSGYFEFGVKVGSITNITGTYDPDPTVNTQTSTINTVVGDQATTANALITDTDIVYVDCSQYARNTDSTIVAKLTKLVDGTWFTQQSIYRMPSLSNYFDGDKVAVAYVSYTYTGTQDWQITPRRVIKLGTTNRANEHVNVPYSLTVGPDAVSTNRGVKYEPFDARGIMIYSDGLQVGSYPKTVFNMTQFTDNSPYYGGTPAERAGGSFIFNHFRGNENTAQTAQYALNGDGFGGLQWFARTSSSSLPSSTYTPAGVYAKATEDFNSSTKQGTGVYLQYSPNSQTASGRPKTFLRAENATTELLAKTTLKLGKITTGTTTTSAGLSATAAATWATIDDTSAAFTVPVKFPAYTKAAAAAITGSMGMQICISDSAQGSDPNGMMAFWDTTNSRWSYVHNNQAL